jgi:hypothetical protein
MLVDAGIFFDREVHIDYRCFNSDTKHFARLDFVMELEDRRVVLEVDENQHKDSSYQVDCDLSRMMYVITAIMSGQNAQRPTEWIRFNPNAFTVDGVYNRVSKKSKLATLRRHLQQRTTSSGTWLTYMFYDVQCGVPTICSDPSYNTHVKSLIKQVVNTCSN